MVLNLTLFLKPAGTSPGQLYCNGQEWGGASSHASSPSPPQLVLSQSAPAKVNIFTSFGFDEGLDNGDLSNQEVRWFTFEIYLHLSGIKIVKLYCINLSM